MEPPCGHAHQSVRNTTTIARRSQSGRSSHINYDVRLQATFDFIITAFVIFVVVKQVTRFKKEGPPAPPPGPTNDVKLLMEVSL